MFDVPNSTIAHLNASFQGSEELPLNTSPEHRQRLERFVADHRPALELKFQAAGRRGEAADKLAGVLSDGKGIAPPACVDIIPIELAREMVAPLRGMGWDQMLNLFDEPQPGTMPILIFFEENPGFGALGYVVVTDFGAKA
jgi:hypothetical protein